VKLQHQLILEHLQASECSTEVYAQSDELVHWVGEMVSRCSVQKVIHHSPHTPPFFLSQVIFAKEPLPGR
jgi:hypothetical protein